MAYYYKRSGTKKNTYRSRKGGGAAKRKTRSKFSSNERAAYNSGRGYAVRHKGKGIQFNDPKLREAFNSGFKAGLRAIAKNPKKYQDLKK